MGYKPEVYTRKSKEAKPMHAGPMFLGTGEKVAEDLLRKTLLINRKTLRAMG